MIPNLIPVQSSMLQAVGHDGTNLFVRFNNGKLYRYDEVPPHQYQAMREADSIGRYLNVYIKPHFTASLVEE